ncbi:MAG: DnaJ domain-containing protein [Synergistaceae bacterium]|nr:DnaJ domain-containing protein [Synergistaceae bacterium]
MFGKKNYYEVLGASPSASEKALKEQFRKLMKIYHPDVTKSPDAAERYAEIMEAYRTLSNKSSRAMYDLANNFTGASSDESPPAPPDEAAPRKETPESRKEHYERLLREKRTREEAYKDGSFSPYTYLARWRCLSIPASSFAIAFLSVFLEKAASRSNGDAGVFTLTGAAFALTLMMWLAYLLFRLSAAYRDYRPPKAVLWIFGFFCACLYDAILGRFYGAAGYGDSFFMNIKGITFLPGLFIFFLIFSCTALFLEMNPRIKREQRQRTGGTASGRARRGS